MRLLPESASLGEITTRASNDYYDGKDDDDDKVVKCITRSRKMKMFGGAVRKMRTR